MNKVLYTVGENKKLAENVYRMTLLGDTSEIKNPGQFVNIKLEGKYLRRPISVCDCEDGKLTIIYKVVGHGTEQMSGLETGAVLDVLSGLGNGYDVTEAEDSPLLIGGGVGVPPLYKLAKELVKQGKKVSVVLGFNTANDVFYVDEFKMLTPNVVVSTVDGSYGKKGFVTDVLPEDYSYIYTCGPEPMLKAVYKASKTSGQFSFEQRMGCGFGACMGCSCKTITGYKRICKDGPVMKKEEILWED